MPPAGAPLRSHGPGADRPILAPATGRCWMGRPPAGCAVRATASPGSRPFGRPTASNDDALRASSALTRSSVSWACFSSVTSTNETTTPSMTFCRVRYGTIRSRASICSARFSRWVSVPAPPVLNRRADVRSGTGSRSRLPYSRLRAKYGKSVRCAQGKTAHLKTEFGFGRVRQGWGEPLRRPRADRAYLPEDGARGSGEAWCRA